MLLRKTGSSMLGSKYILLLVLWCQLWASVICSCAGGDPHPWKTSCYIWLTCDASWSQLCHTSKYWLCSHHDKAGRLICILQANLQLTCSGQRLPAWWCGVGNDTSSVYPSLHMLAARDQTKLTTLLWSASLRGNSGPAARPPKDSALFGLQMKSGNQKGPGVSSLT